MGKDSEDLLDKNIYKPAAHKGLRLAEFPATAWLTAFPVRFLPVPTWAIC